LVMFPFIQCHQTRGAAAWGGFRNPSARLLPASPFGELHCQSMIASNKEMGMKLSSRFMMVLCSYSGLNF